MRTFIAKVLILFVLFGNIAWAADLDEIHLGEADITVQDGQHNLPVQDSCDHCCHGTAHFMGIFTQLDKLAGIEPLRFINTSIKTRYFNSLQPPTPPPTA